MREVFNDLHDLHQITIKEKSKYLIKLANYERFCVKKVTENYKSKKKEKKTEKKVKNDERVRKNVIESKA